MLPFKDALNNKQHGCRVRTRLITTSKPQKYKFKIALKTRRRAAKSRMMRGARSEGRTEDFRREKDGS